MIAGRDVRKFVILEDKSAVLVEELQDQGKAFFVESGGRTKEIESGEQVDRPQSDFHSAVPVCSASVRVLLHPASDMSKKCRGISLVAGDTIGTRECDSVTEAVQFP